MTTRRYGGPIVILACALSAVGCGRGEGQADAHHQASAAQAGRDAHGERAADTAHPTMRVTGCIERGVIPGSFMLTQVDVAGTDGAASTIPGGSPGTSGQADDRALAGNRTDADIATTPTYTLRSLERGTDLGKYIGKRVAVTGRLTADRDQTGLGTRGTTGSEPSGAADDKLRSERPGGTAAAGAMPAPAQVRQLDAQSIRTVAGTCTPAQQRR
jgi:hypothetical protein